jgi:hypothetical protein
MLKMWNETEKLIEVKEMQRNSVLIKRKEKKRVLHSSSASSTLYPESPI